MYKLPLIPTPPETINAPVVVEVDDVVLVMLTALSVVAPNSVTVCKEAVDHTVTSPVEVLTAVPVPAVILPTPAPPSVFAVKYPAPLAN